jgi:hypothetical protein
MRHAKSVSPYDHGKLEEQPAPTPRATYPQSMRLADGTMFLFYRAGGHPAPWCVRTSTDDCKTWSKEARVIEMRIKPRHGRAAAYVRFFPGRHGKTVHCVFNYKEDDRGRWPKAYRGLHEAVYRFNIYYIRRDEKGAWHNAQGTPVSLPVSKAEADAKCKVYDSGDLFSYPNHYAADEKNKPYLRFSTGAKDWRSPKVFVPMRTKYACLRDGKWEVTDKLPDDWPASVKGVMQGRGEAAYGVHANGMLGPWYRDPWFIYFSYRPAPTKMYLHSLTHGFAARKGGPTKLE